MRKIVYFVVCSLLTCMCVVGVNSCFGGGNGDDDIDSTAFRLPDTLKAVTLYGPLSFFMIRGDTMGYDYSLIKDFAQTKGIVLNIEIATNIDSALRMLEAGEVDVIAHGVPVTSQYLEHIDPCGPEILTSQVLVQEIRRGKPMVTDVTELVGKDVVVVNNSKYEQRLRNLNSELGGGINIITVDADSLSEDDLIESVSMGKIPLSVVDSDIALLNKTYFRNIDVSLELSFAQKSMWGVSPDRSWLGDSITAWFNAEGTRRENELLLKKYFESSKNGPDFDLFTSLSKGKVSIYDDIFKKNAKRIGWDWRLLASMGYVESKFNNNLTSWAGARGLMQLMPSTARAYGKNPDELIDPEISIAMAADVLKHHEEMMARYVDDPEQRRMLAIAAYNSGAAHIIDAVALAKKYGYDSDQWYGNVEKALLMKRDPKYYLDPVVKYGYFRGTQTATYVRHVFDFYNRIKKHVK